MNEYTNVSTPGYQEVVGVAVATNTVTVNSLAPDRKVEYFHREVSTTNGGGPVWQNVSAIAGTTTNSGGMIFPASSQNMAYDADGNLTYDGVWNYTWDGENRLITMTMTNVGNIANSNRLRLDLAYDYMGRRVSKTVSSWNGSSFTPQSTNYFLYDGWNVIAALSPSTTVSQAFTWGLDLSGTMANAGGVGGLLNFATAGTSCFAGYDGNGNITILANAGDKSTAARYEYSPFGQLIRTTGPLARQNPIRFSTKFWDDECGLVHYGYRYYSPSMGRWIGRDTAGETASLALFLFCQNNGINNFDTDGRFGTGLATFFELAEFNTPGITRQAELLALLNEEKAASAKALDNILPQLSEGLTVAGETAKFGGDQILDVMTDLLINPGATDTLETDADLMDMEFSDYKFYGNPQT